MPRIAIVFGSLLVLVGVGFYVGTGAASITALIPAFIGLPLALLGGLATRENLRRHAMHGAAALGLLGFFGSARGLAQLPALLSGEPLARPAAVAGQSLTAALCLVFVILCVRSFVEARRKA
jgi:lysylphosphatidylglycerol synthetase-like protein (DUF2156 family)